MMDNLLLQVQNCHWKRLISGDIIFYYFFYVGKIELVSKELNHLAAILHVYAGDLNFMK